LIPISFRRLIQAACGSSAIALIEVGGAEVAVRFAANEHVVAERRMEAATATMAFIAPRRALSR
jgi:hypothetical protein